MNSSSSELRIIDACLNRASEGLRVLEDIARLMLNDAALTSQLKNLRHELNVAKLPLDSLLQARDSAGDVGMDIEAPGQDKQKGVPDIVAANSRRVQESLRTLEEMAKLPDSPMDSEKFRHARFVLYVIEKELVFRLERKIKIGRLSGLHIILDTGMEKDNYLKLAQKAIKAGAKAVHLHDNTGSRKELLKIAGWLKELCTANNALFIVHSHLDIALAVEADGLQLEPDDLPVSIARKLMPLHMIIGCAVAGIEQAVAAEAEGADYLSASVDMVQQVKKTTTLPLIAVGGITKSNVNKIMAAGAVGAALISASLDENPEVAIRQIVEKIEEKK